MSELGDEIAEDIFSMIDEMEAEQKKIRNKTLDLFLAECEKALIPLGVMSGENAMEHLIQIAKRMRGE